MKKVPNSDDQLKKNIENIMENTYTIKLLETTKETLH